MTPSFLCYALFIFCTWGQLFFEWMAFTTGVSLPLPLWLPLPLTLGGMVFWIFWGGLKARPLPYGTWKWFTPFLLLALLVTPFPDGSHDNWYYHSYLHYFSFEKLAGDLFPGGLGTYLFPLSDRVFGAFRTLFGYRVGTLPNLACMAVLFGQLGWFLRDLVPAKWLGPAVAAILFCEFIVINLGSYNNDLLPLPLVWQLAVEGTKRSTGSPFNLKRLGGYALIAGMAVALKLTQVFFIFALLPLFLMSSGVVGFVYAAFSTGAGIATFTLPFLAYTWKQTGNPLFFMANGFFHGPYFPAVDFKDNRWGPVNFTEQFSYFLTLFFTPTRASEMGYNSGRITLGALVTLFVLILAIKRKTIKTVLPFAVLFFCSLVVWQKSSGYLRYGLFLDLTAGVVLVLFLVSREIKWAKQVTGLLLGAQVLFALHILFTYPDWSGRRLARLNLRQLARDYGAFFTDQDGKRRDPALDKAAGTLSFLGYGGLSTLITPDKPAVQVNFWWQGGAPRLLERTKAKIAEVVKANPAWVTFYFLEDEAELKVEMAKYGVVRTGKPFPCLSLAQQRPFNLICSQVGQGN